MSTTWPSADRGARTPDEIYSRSPDEREALFEELSPEDYFHLSIPVMDTYRTTSVRSRRSLPQTPRHIQHVATTDDPLQPGLTRANRSKSRIDLKNLEYVDTFDQNLMCAICHCPFIDPVALICDHVFCSECIREALLHQSREARNCPTCRRKTDDCKLLSVPKLISRILDELPVKCPRHDKGCKEVMTRGSVQSHVDRYCGFEEIDCPSERCIRKLPRKDAIGSRCLHWLVACEDCHSNVIELDLGHHRDKACESRKATCPDCKMEMLHRDLGAHKEGCPEATFPCSASSYGCDFISKRDGLNQHQNTCPLRKLSPFLEAQNARLEDHAAALKHLKRKNTIYQASLTNMQEFLGLNGTNSPPSLPLGPASSPSAPAPFDSTAAHLLSLHESLREEVSRVSNTIAELDAKTSTMVINESLRNKEDMAHTNAVLTNLRVQLQWLMSSKLQSQQRAAVLRTQSPAEAGPSALAGSGNGSAGGAGGVVELPRRRLSDSSRQETKL